MFITLTINKVATFFTVKIIRIIIFFITFEGVFLLTLKFNICENKNMFSCSRVFEDNSHYNEVFGPYGNAFVGAIEWLFTDEMSDGKPNVL